jgi:hypothetical protein
MHRAPMTQEDQIDLRPVVVCIAGFGDNSSMFDGLRNTAKAERVDFVPLVSVIKGFGSSGLVN